MVSSENGPQRHCLPDFDERTPTTPETPGGPWALPLRSVSEQTRTVNASAGTTQVRIYDDRLEVWNPGTLPPGLTIEQLYTEHPSLPPNRLVADAFHRARLIEHWGTGTLRIVRGCDEAGLPRPEFASDMGQFIVRFTSPVNGVRVVEAADLNERQQRAVAYVREHGRITSSEHCALTGIGKVQGVRDLNALVGTGILSRRGGGRAVHYVLPGSADTERLVND